MTDKTHVMAKIRSLSETYTIEKFQEIESFISDEASEELAKLLQQEIDNEIMRSILEASGWHRVMVKNYTEITDSWCKKYLKSSYNCFGHYWYFEDLHDANFFILKWGSI